MRGLGAFGPLLGQATIVAVFASMYVLLGKNPPDELSSVSGFCYLLFVVHWMVVDARRRHCVPCHDFGFLAGVFLPAALPWYLIWTRGDRGLLPLIISLLLLLLPSLCASLVWLLKHGR
jgi:hypothetical protein